MFHPRLAFSCFGMKFLITYGYGYMDDFGTIFSLHIMRDLYRLKIYFRYTTYDI